MSERVRKIERERERTGTLNGGTQGNTSPLHVSASKALATMLGMVYASGPQDPNQFNPARKTRALNPVPMGPPWGDLKRRPILALHLARPRVEGAGSGV